MPELCSSAPADQLPKKRLDTLAAPSSSSSSDPEHSLSNHLNRWEEELLNDHDSPFLLQGIRDGFRITDPDRTLKPAEVSNYYDTSPEVVNKVAEQIITEVKNGRYVITDSKPTIVSGLGAIIKPSGGVRLIHDCSRPLEGSINSMASDEHCHYQTLKEATEFIKPGYFMAKLDLESAFRSVPLHPDEFEVTGMKFKFPGNSRSSYLYDTRLPFGAKKSPSIFNRLTQSVRRMMAKRGYHRLIAYLDDFLIVAPTKEECKAALNTLLRLLRDLGFAISYNKVEAPTQIITFLGIQISSLDMRLSLPEEKATTLESLLDSFADRRHATRTQLQSLAGKLNWACQVVTGGRTFLRRILSSIDALAKPRHKLRLDSLFFADLRWWKDFFHHFHGTTISSAISRPTVAIEMDSCGSASGITYEDDWLFSHWESDAPLMASWHINHKEAASAVLAARRWGHLWSGCEVVVFSDNKAAIGMLNKGSTPHEPMMTLLRELFWLSATHDFSISATYLPGASNLFADTVSRLHLGSNLLQWTLLSQIDLVPDCLDRFVSCLINHMSPLSLFQLLPQLPRLGMIRASSTRK